MIYVLKFEQPLGNPQNARAMAQFYVGYCDDHRLEERLAEHRAGQGAAITRACNVRGIAFDVVLTLSGGRTVEHYLKHTYKNTPKLLARYERNPQQLQMWIDQAVAKGTL